MRTRPAQLARLARRLADDDLLIAFAAPPPEEGLLPVGVAGAGFDANLTSDSTRTDGVVITPDVAATILEHLGVAVPDDVNGSEIRSEGDRDPRAVEDLRNRLEERPSRDVVLLLPLGAWLVATAAAAIALGRRGARPALMLLALACAWAPLLLLVEAAADLGNLGGALLIGIGSVVLAAATAAIAPGYRGLALACAATVGAHAIDVVAGSPLTALSVLGPNPAGGVRFFGIGNELEAILTTLTLIGTGAWLSSRAPGVDGRQAAIWFAVIAAICVAAFAPGRFGADVGAAIVLGTGAAAAAGLSLGLSIPRTVALVVAAGLAGLAALFAVDLALGGAHLSRSVLGAGEPGRIADVLDRRVTLMVRTFTHPIYPELLLASGAALIAGLARAGRVLAWFGDRPAARNGFLGALVGVLIGTLANDSGSVLLVLGTIYLAVAAGFAWATGEGGAPGLGMGDSRTWESA